MFPEMTLAQSRSSYECRDDRLDVVEHTHNIQPTTCSYSLYLQFGHVNNMPSRQQMLPKFHLRLLIFFYFGLATPDAWKPVLLCSCFSLSSSCD